ncbi:MAG: hypothetical protein FD147_1336 [Chloroflexi bacterium]|nr:MAG: hypothetical protein FD147_1336 [Chloroflexota bacterium]
MIRLQLEEEEKTVLLQLLENCLSDLRMQIAATDNIDYKMMLKGRKAVLLKLQDALQATQPIAIAE